MLTFDEQLKLANTIATLSGKQFRWSETDCNAFVARCIDAVCNTDYYKKEINGKYHSAQDAVRFQRRTLTPAQFLFKQGYKEITAEAGVQNGDIIIVNERNFECAHIVFANAVWSSSPEHGVGAHEINLPEGSRIFRKAVQ
jgi:3-mercaptopyruvate sulfurtransferase SseA